MMRPSSRLIDMIGKTSGHLTVIERAAHGKWLCLCACGEKRIHGGDQLRRGVVKSCGCRHYHWAHSFTNKQVLHIWNGIKKRCLDPTSRDYPQYGGRGIKICDRWLVLKNFAADMGPRPSARHSVDRINVNGDYEPSNCRWATCWEQSNNTRRNPRYCINGEMLTGSEAYKKYSPSVSLSTFKARLRYGWSIDRAVLSLGGVG